MPFPPGDLYGLGQTSTKTSQNEQKGTGSTNANITVMGPVNCSSLKVPILTTSGKFTASPARIPYVQAASQFRYPTSGFTSLISTLPTRLPIVNVLNPTGWDAGSNLIAVPEKGWYVVTGTSLGDISTLATVNILYSIKNTFTSELSGIMDHTIGATLDGLYARPQFNIQFYIKCTSPSQDRWEILFLTSGVNVTNYAFTCNIFCLNQAQ